MPFEVNKSQVFNYPFDQVYQAAYLMVKKNGGKVSQHKPDEKKLHAEMDKKIQGKVLGDRSHLEFGFEEQADGGTLVKVFGYPLNAVGQKLMFGARPGVTKTVIDILLEDMQKKLEEGT